jgi:uncharacterized surface anchored protein
MSECQGDSLRMGQANHRPSRHRQQQTLLRKIKSVIDRRDNIENRDIPDSREIVTECTSRQMAVQTSGDNSTGSGSGYPGIGAIKTTSLAETCCKDGKVRWATESRLYP